MNSNELYQAARGYICTSVQDVISGSTHWVVADLPVIREALRQAKVERYKSKVKVFEQHIRRLEKLEKDQCVK